MKKYMRPHCGCPYYSSDHSCSRTRGCLFIIPCTLVNYPHPELVLKKRKKKRGA